MKLPSKSSFPAYKHFVLLEPKRSQLADGLYGFHSTSACQSLGQSRQHHFLYN